MTKDEKPKGRDLGWILWWQISPAEMDKQVSGYKTLPLWQSARGISLFLLLFSAALTVALIVFIHMSPGSYLDAGISLVLGLFILAGHRWACVAAMVYWTLEKVVGVADSAIHGGGATIISQLVFWTIYMHAFYLALQVENQRRKRPVDVPEIFS